MRAIRVYRFGGPEVLVFENVDRPVPGKGEVLVRVEAAGVGPWDAWIRSGRSALPQPLPLTPGSDVAGIIEEIGPEVRDFRKGDLIYGVTNSRFINGYAEFAVMTAAMIAPKPSLLSFIEAAAVPVVAVTAWQMLFEHAKIQAGQRVLILGASGSVGSAAVQMASRHGAYLLADSSSETERLAKLGVRETVDFRDLDRLQGLEPVNAVIDAAGGERQVAAAGKLKKGGVLISAVAAPHPKLLEERGISGRFFLVNVTTNCLNQITTLIEDKSLSIRVGTVLPLSDAIVAHQMLDRRRPYSRGKIVLKGGE